MWPLRQWWRDPGPLPPLPPPPPSPLEVAANRIAVTEFPGTVKTLYIGKGILDGTCTVRGPNGEWLAEVCQDRATGQMYRIRREPLV